MPTRRAPTRRAVFLPAAFAAAVPSLVPSLSWAQVLAPRQPPSRAQQGGEELTPTPQCIESKDAASKDTLTLPLAEGPYYKPGSPERHNLNENGITGTPLRVGGYVLTRSCRPVPKALVDLWQANDAGQYDEEGFRLRGHRYTDEQGRWQFETIVPGLYAGRTRHLHMKVQAPGRDVLTTQLFFPADEQRNIRDSLFNKRLLMTVAANEAGQIGRFDFVLDMA